MKIDTYKFYMIGVICFGIAAIMNTATLLQTYKVYMPTSLISQIASLIFNYAIWGFFWWLWKGLPPKNMKPATDKEMEIILKDGIKNERGNK